MTCTIKPEPTLSSIGTRQKQRSMRAQANSCREGQQDERYLCIPCPSARCFFSTPWFQPMKLDCHNRVFHERASQHPFEQRPCVVRLSAVQLPLPRWLSLQLDRSRSEQRPEDAPDSKTPEDRAKGNKSQRSAAGGGSASPSGQRRDWERFSSNAKRFERQR